MGKSAKKAAVEAPPLATPDLVNLHRLSLIVIMVGLAVLSLQAFAGPDIWYHLFLGRQIFETGTASPSDHLLIEQTHFVNIYWLFQVLCYGAYKLGGASSLGALFVTVWCGVGWYWAKTLELMRRPVGGLLALVTVLVAQVRFEQRPETFAYLLCMMMIFWLTSWDFKRRLSRQQLTKFGVAQLIFVNMHGYFVFGPLLIGLKLVSEEARGNSSRRSLLVLLAVSLAASMASPHGAQSWIYVSNLWAFLNDMKASIIEFQPPNGIFLGLWNIWIFWGLAVVTGFHLVVTAFTKRRRGLFALLLAAVGLWLSTQSLRMVPFLLIFSAPLWSEGVASLATFQARKPRGKWSLALPLVVLVATICLVAWTIMGGLHRSLASETRFGTEVLSSAYPVHFVDYLKKEVPMGPIFNVSSDGGFLEFNFPEQTFFGDSRFVDAKPVRQYFEAAKHPESFNQLNAKHQFAGVLLKVRENAELIKALMTSPDWTFRYGDPQYAFFARAAGHERSAATEATTHFYLGEDLSLKSDGMAAIQWVDILATTKQRDLLVKALDDLGGSTVIPSFVLEKVIQYGLAHRDEDLLYQALELRPKMLALTKEDQRIVDELIKRFKP